MPFNPLSILNGPMPNGVGGGKGVGGSGAVRIAIANASRKTGVDFTYLLGQAKLESGLRADAKAGTSSASGLYQFVDRSWLGVMKAHGAEHGLGWAADAITISGGRATVADPAMRRAILDLRNDPDVAALMAAEHASDNKSGLERALGRDATGTDLYMAHFLGLGGARSFLGALQTAPGSSGAAMFPAAARVNRNVFFDASGGARSLSDIYTRFAAKLAQAGSGAGGEGGAVPAASGLTAARLGQWDADVIPGNGEDSTSEAAAWAQTTLDRLSGAVSGAAGARVEQASLLRPTPATARLAYMLLASMGA